MNASSGTTQILDGFWLPAHLRQRLLENVAWETSWLKNGVLSSTESDGAVGIRWPRLGTTSWHLLLAKMQEARMVGGREVLARWKAALEEVQKRLFKEAGGMAIILSKATGYSSEMIKASLWQSDFINLDLLTAAVDYRPTWSLANQWEGVPGLPGRLRFFPSGSPGNGFARLRPRTPLFKPAPPVDLVLGYAAGNVPGTALLISTLGAVANSYKERQEASPAVLVRNSRHEPLFAPWVLSIVEAVDPALVADMAVLIWDYEETELQAMLMREAGLILAAAGDDTIQALDAIRQAHAPQLRFHRHGHKVSFAAMQEPAEQDAFLAALDSCMWDQNGCLSARVHFLEGDAEGYAAALTREMRNLAGILPRGHTPRRFLHRAYDTYAALQPYGDVKVFSEYEDDFAVVLDKRPWQAYHLRQGVNACIGRVVIVRPVDSLRQAAQSIAWLPAENLQSVSVKLDNAALEGFANQCGKCGVTSIRSLGRAAFPQLAGSWDGVIPLDIGHIRPPGHFTMIEFSDLKMEVEQTLAKWKHFR